MSSKLKVTIFGWKPGLNKVYLTRFLAKDIGIVGQGHVVSKLISENREIVFDIDASEESRVRELLCEWKTVFRIESQN